MPRTAARGCFLNLRVAKARDGGAKMRLRRIPELDDERMAVERLLDDAALDALAAPVNQAHLAQAAFPCGVDVLLDDRLDVAGGEGVQIERLFDRHPLHRDLGVGISVLRFSAV